MTMSECALIASKSIPLDLLFIFFIEKLAIAVSIMQNGHGLTQSGRGCKNSMHASRNWILGPPNLQYLPTPMRYRINKVFPASCLLAGKILKLYQFQRDQALVSLHQTTDRYRSHLFTSKLLETKSHLLQNSSIS